MKIVFVIVVFILGIMLAMTCNGQQYSGRGHYGIFGYKKTVADTSKFVIFLPEKAQVKADTITGVCFIYDHSIACYRVDSVKYTIGGFEHFPLDRKVVGYYTLEDSAIIKFISGNHPVFIPGHLITKKDYKWQQK